MNSRSTVSIRRAQIDDADALARLGRALNRQQGDPDEFFTAEAVRRDGFGATPRFEAWIAERAGEAIGYALVVPAAYETGYAKAGVYVQDLFVAPEARRCGAARSLLAAIAADTRARGLEFMWLASRAWNTESHAFFRTVASVEEPVLAFAIFGDELATLADQSS